MSPAAGFRAGLCLALALCSCTTSPDAAKKQLADSGVSFTPEEFVRRAGTDPWSTLELFLSAGMDPNVKADAGPYLPGVTAIMMAARSGREDVVRRLVKAGGALDAETRQGNTALMYAASGCQPQMVGFLLSHAADANHANRAGQTALMWAIPAS